MNDTLGIIPARWASSRFPGKPLALIGGVTMIERVCRQAVTALGADNVVVATDDARIAAAVKAFGGRAVMTAATHRSGTDRCREAFDIVVAEGGTYRYAVNIQGDEPFVDPSQIRQVAELLHRPDTEIATLARPFPATATYDDLADPNTPKVVWADDGRALYFSRSPIPYMRGVDPDRWCEACTHYAHVGMYGFTAEALHEVARLPQSALEKAEGLEQLRWLQAGMAIRVAVTTIPTIGIDTPADLEAANRLLLDRQS